MSPGHSGGFDLVISVIPALLTTFLWAAGATVSYRLTRLMGPEAANFWRLLLAATLLAVWVLPFHGAGPEASRGWLFLSGIVGFGIGDIALYYALPRIGSRLTLLMVQCLAAPIGILVGWVWLGQSLGARELASAAMILSGVGVALAPGSHKVPGKDVGSGVFWGFVAALGQAFGALISSHGMTLASEAGTPVSGVVAAHGRIWGGVIVAGAFLAWRVKGRHTHWFSAPGSPAPAARSVVGWLLATALLGPVVGASCYQWALGSAPTGIVLAIVATTPLVVMPLAGWLEGDKPGWRAALGGVVAVAGVVLLGLAD